MSLILGCGLSLQTPVLEKQNTSQLVARGPTYKEDLTVDGIPTRGLMDHGAQVSLVCKELLATIKEHHGWSKEQCSTHSLKTKLQPVGAEGGPL